MLTRRNFLRGLITSVASAALVKNGIVQPEQAIAEPERRVFDMAANTWQYGRSPLEGAWPIWWKHQHCESVLFGYPVREWVDPPAMDSPIELVSLDPVNCRCLIPDHIDLRLRIQTPAKYLSVFEDDTVRVNWGIDGEPIILNQDMRVAHVEKTPDGLWVEYELRGITP